MAEPTRPHADAARPASGRRPVGRLGLLSWFVVPALLLAGLTQVQVALVPPPGVTDAQPGPEPPAGRHLSFGSVTRQGAIVFEVGQPVHVRSFGADGSVRWQRDLVDGEYITCGPCPGAVLVEPDGTPRTIAADGALGPGPTELGGHVVQTTSLTGVVLAAARVDGPVDFYTPTSAGLVPAGRADDAGLDRSLVVVTPADRGGAVTILRQSADPLRQGEFEVEHIDPAGTHTETVALDTPAARPRPCAVADADVVAYVQLEPGPTADGTTHVVAERGGRSVLDARVAGLFDSCAIGGAGAVLTAAANGADGDLSRTRVDIAWVGLDGSVRASTSEQVEGTSASVAVDADRARVAIAGGTGPAVVVEPSGRQPRSPALAVAFDDAGGLWWADAPDHVTRSEAP